MAVPRAPLLSHLCLPGPTDDAAPSASPQISLFPPSERLKTFTPSSMFRCPSSFLFHKRALSSQPVRNKVRRTRRIVPRACRLKRFGSRRQLRRSSSNCRNQVRGVKVHPIKNELSSPIFFFSGSPNFPNQVREAKVRLVKNGLRNGTGFAFCKLSVSPRWY